MASNAGKTQVILVKPLDGDSQPSLPRLGHPLGPLTSWRALEQPIVGRLYAAGVLLTATAIWVTAARLQPDTHRFGTHEQLGLPPCGFLVITRLPCPTCGMTTAFVNTVHGDLWQAARTQLAGLVLALSSLATGVCSLIALLSGRGLAINWYRIPPIHVVWWAVTLLIGAWGLKIVLGLLDGTLPVR